MGHDGCLYVEAVPSADETMRPSAVSQKQLAGLRLTLPRGFQTDDYSTMVGCNTDCGGGVVHFDVGMGLDRARSSRHVQWRAVKKAEAQLERLERATHIPVVIETIAEVPGPDKKRVRAEKKEAINALGGAAATMRSRMRESTF